MSTSDIIESKISYIEKQLHAAKEYRRYTADSLREDMFARNAMERQLYVIAQAVIDLAEAVIAYKNLRRPTTMRESFSILEEAGILPREFVKNFIGKVKFLYLSDTDLVFKKRPGNL